MVHIFKNKIKNFQGKKPFSNLSVNIFNDNLKNISMNPEYKNLIYYPASTKEWFSSIYSYNKSYIKSLIVYDSRLNSLLGAYANRLKTQVRKFRRRRNKKIRYSANKLYLSRAELKHTNTKLVVLVYLFNKQKFTFQRFLINLCKLVKATKPMWTFFDKYRLILKSLTTVECLKGNSHEKLIKSNRHKVLRKSIYFWLKKKYNKLSAGLKKNLLTKKRIPYNNKSSTSLLKIKTWTDFPTYYIWSNQFKEENSILNTAKNLNFNGFKFSHLSLSLENLGLLRFIQKIYGNRVEFKVVDMKSVHLNSDIISSAVALKLRNRKNKAVRVLRKAIWKMVRMPDLHTLITFDDNKPIMDKSNYLNVINQQVVSGVRFEAAGRLTRRLTAMRAVFKYRYAGSLKNIRSSFNGKSSTILRGVLKSNGHYTLINSKTRNGTFGLKGWVSTH